MALYCRPQSSEILALGRHMVRNLAADFNFEHKRGRRLLRFPCGRSRNVFSLSPPTAFDEVIYCNVRTSARPWVEMQQPRGFFLPPQVHLPCGSEGVVATQSRKLGQVEPPFQRACGNLLHE